MITLDAAIHAFGRPTYCKVDVEGWEFEVLRGLTQGLPLISFEFHLNDADARNTRACLEWLLELGATHANLTPAERSTFHFPDWIPVRELLDWFPGDLGSTLPGLPYGDIYVRTDAA